MEEIYQKIRRLGVVRSLPDPVKLHGRGALFRLLAASRALRLLLTGKTEDQYCIKPFYLPRAQYIHFDARTSSNIHQDLVYQDLRDFFIDNKLSSLLDVGCGTGFKLLKYFSDYSTLGLERPPVLEHLVATYPERRWELSDFRQVPTGSFDMVICIDVIEHLIDPDELIALLSRIDCRYLALSTPDRDLLGSTANVGPPRNRHHVREWSRKEFVKYVGKTFEVLRSEVVSRHEHFVICRVG
jgi:SAM-dependent methyltransferase